MDALNVTNQLPMLHGAEISFFVRKVSVILGYSAVFPKITEQFSV